MRITQRPTSQLTIVKAEGALTRGYEISKSADVKNVDAIWGQLTATVEPD